MRNSRADRYRQRSKNLPGPVRRLVLKGLKKGDFGQQRKRKMGQSWKVGREVSERIAMRSKKGGHNEEVTKKMVGG